MLEILKKYWHYSVIAILLGLQIYSINEISNLKQNYKKHYRLNSGRYTQLNSKIKDVKTNYLTSPWTLYNKASKEFYENDHSTNALEILTMLVDSFPSSPYSEYSIQLIDTVVTSDKRWFQERKATIEKLSKIEKVSHYKEIAENKQWIYEVRKIAEKLYKENEYNYIEELYSEVGDQPIDSLLQKIEKVITKDDVSEWLKIRLKKERTYFEKFKLQGEYRASEELANQYSSNKLVFNDRFNNETVLVNGKILSLQESKIDQYLSFFKDALGSHIDKGGALMIIESYPGNIICYIKDRSQLEDLRENQNQIISFKGDYYSMANSFVKTALNSSLRSNRLTVPFDNLFLDYKVSEDDLFLFNCEIIDKVYGLNIDFHLNKLMLLLRDSVILSKKELIERIRIFYALKTVKEAEDIYNYLECRKITPIINKTINNIKCNQINYSLIGRWSSTSGNLFDVYNEKDTLYYSSSKTEWSRKLKRIDQNVYKHKNKYFEFLVQMISNDIAIWYEIEQGDYNIWKRKE